MSVVFGVNEAQSVAHIGEESVMIVKESQRLLSQGMHSKRILVWKHDKGSVLRAQEFSAGTAGNPRKAVKAHLKSPSSMMATGTIMKLPRRIP